jgi:hypothetical protein
VFTQPATIVQAQKYASLLPEGARIALPETLQHAITAHSATAALERTTSNTISLLSATRPVQDRYLHFYLTPFQGQFESQSRLTETISAMILE